MFDPHPIADAPDRRHGRIQPDERLHLSVDGVRDSIHASDRLHHGRLHVADMFEAVGREDRLVRKQVLERKRGKRDRRLRIAARLHRVSRLALGDIFGIPGQHLTQQAELVLRGELIERVLVDRLGEQLGHMAEEILDHPPLGIDFAAEVPARVAVGVDERLELDFEAARVAQDQPVSARDAGRARVQIEAGVEGRDLIGPAHLGNPIAPADGPRPAADPVARLDDRHPIAGPLELVGGHQSGDPGPEDHHRSPMPARCGKRESFRARGSRERQPQRLHGHVGRAETADPSKLFEQCAASECHRCFPPAARLADASRAAD